MKGDRSRAALNEARNVIKPARGSRGGRKDGRFSELARAATSSPLYALAVGLLGLIGTSYATAGIVVGARTELFAPKTIHVRAHQYRNDETWYLRFNAAMDYVNTGQERFSSVVTLESLEVFFPETSWADIGEVPGTVYRRHLGREVHHVGDFFETYYRLPEETKVLVKFDGTAGPFAVPGSSARSHNVSFEPQIVACPHRECPPGEQSANFVRYDEFLQRVFDRPLLRFVVGARLEERFLLVFRTETTQRVPCDVQVTEGLAFLLARDSEVTWPCRPRPLPERWWRKVGRLYFG